VAENIVVASNLSFGRGVIVIDASQAHLAHVGTLSGSGISPYPASYPRRLVKGQPSILGFLSPFDAPALAC